MGSRVISGFWTRIMLVILAGILFFAGTQEPLLVARGLFKDGVYKLAAMEYRAYAVENPEGDYTEEALFYAGLCYYKLGDFEESLSYFEDAATRRGEYRAEALYFLGEGSYLVRQLERSEKAFEGILKEFPDSRRTGAARERLGRVNYLLGNQLFGRGVYSQSLERYEKAASYAPGFSGLAGFRKGQALAKMGRLDEAAQQWSQLAKDPKLSGTEVARLAGFSLAAVLEKSGKAGEAVSGYGTFLASAPDLFFEFRAAAEMGIVRSLAAGGDREKAVQYWRQSQTGVQLEKGYAAYEKAYHHYLLREYPDAREALKPLITLRSLDDVRVLAFRLTAAMERDEGRTLAALELLERMRVEYGERAGDAVWLEMAELNFDLGNWIKAQEDLQSVSRYAEKWIRARAAFLGAQIYYRQGEHSGAEEAFSAYLNDFPGGRDVAAAYLRRGELRAKRGDDELATHDLIQVEARGGRGDLLLRSLELLVETYRRQGLLDSSLSAAERAKELAGRLPTSEDRAKEDQARLYFRKGDYEKGLAVFSELAEDTNAERRATYQYEQGWGCYRMKQYDRARRIFSDLSGGESDWAVPSAIYLSRIMEEEGDMEGGMQLLGSVRTSDPDLASRLLYFQGYNRERAKDFAKALEYYRSIERDYPSSLIGVRWPIMRCLLHAGDLAGFLESIPALEAGPDALISEDRIRLNILSAYEKGDLKALEQWEAVQEVIAVRADSLEETRVLRARLKMSLGDRAGGIDEMKALLKDSPLTGFRDLVVFSLACDAFRDKRCGEVLDLMRGFTPEHLSREESAWVHHMRGTCFEIVGDVDAMSEEFLSVLEDYPDVLSFPTQHLRMGAALIKAGRYEEALTLLRSSLLEVQDDASRAEAQYWIGECYQALGHDEASATEYLKVSYLYPEQTMWSVTAMYQAAMVLVRLGQYDQAIHLLDIVVKATKDSRQGEYAKKQLNELKEQLGK